MEKTILCLTLIFIFTSIVYDPSWAEDVCNQQDSTLVTIKSAVEQKFLIDYVFNTSDGNNVWIGAERRLDSSSEFVWSDGTPVLRFTNWAIGRPSDDVRRPCVHMQSPLSRNFSEMEWVDVSCNNGYWFICEKLQAWPIFRFQRIILSTRRELQYSVDSFTKLMTDMRNDFTSQLNSLTNEMTELMTDMRSDFNSQLNSLRNEMTDTKNTLSTQVQELQAHPVPIGFIYVQLPNQPEPRTIWGTVGWTEITSQYAGLFFRAEGGDSAAFGSIQAESSPRLTRVNRQLNPSSTYSTANLIANGLDSNPIGIGDINVALWGLTFRVSEAEVRPRNQAIRIWRRI